MINIHTATLKDINLLHGFGQPVAEFRVNDTTVNFWPIDILASAIESEDVVVLIARDGSKFAGFVIVNYNRGLRKAIIENIYVAPAIREKGVGGKLLAKALAMLAERGCEYVVTLIPADSENPKESSKASNLYQQAGFTMGETFLWFDMPLANRFEMPKSSPQSKTN